MEYCPYCESEMTDGDSGEPDYIPGYWCDECKEFFTDQDIADAGVPPDPDEDRLEHPY